MATTLRALRDAITKGVEYLDEDTGKVYSDPEGLRLSRSMEPTEYVLGDKGAPVRDGAGRIIHVERLQEAANAHYYQQSANLYGKKFRCASRGDDGRLVAMDLAPSDVHTAAAITNYVGGYHLADGIADVMSPVVMTPKQTDVYYTWNAASDFQRKIPNSSAPGAAVAEVNPGLSPSTFTTVEYALGGFLPTEIQSNADAPLRPFSKMTQIIVDALRLEREYRVATLLQTSGSWNSSVVTTIAAGAQWNGGASSDPVANLHHAMEQSYMDVTGLGWSELVEHDFLRNPQVQKYFTFKDMIDGLPDPAKLSSVLNLPPIYTAKMKYLSSGSSINYVWGNHVVLLHQPKESPPTSQMDVASSYTFRWNGGTAPDGSLAAGFLVRTFYDPKRGARGGTQVVCVHNDAEQMTSGFAGALLLNCHQ